MAKKPPKRPRRVKAKPAAGRRPRSKALVRAEHHRRPVRLDWKQRGVLDEAVRRGEAARKCAEGALEDYGSWLLSAVFEGDTADALDDATVRPVWLELIRRAGGPTLGLGRGTLQNALRVAAVDKRLNDGRWRELEFWKKVLLLPLREPALLREAAAHVLAHSLSHTQIGDYVGATLAGMGKPKQTRVTHTSISRGARALTDKLGSVQVLKRAAAMRAELTPAQRADLVKDLGALRDVLTALLRTFAGTS